MGKVKSINQYRLTPGFGGFTPVSHVTTACRLPCRWRGISRTYRKLKTRRYRCPRLMPREPFCFSLHSGGFPLHGRFYTVTGCFLYLHRFPGTLSLCQAGIYLSRLISRAFFFSPDTFSPAMARRYTIRPPHSTHSNGSRLRNCFTICA